MVECCTGLQETEEELKEFLKEHPEFDNNIFESGMDEEKFNL